LTKLNLAAPAADLEKLNLNQTHSCCRYAFLYNSYLVPATVVEWDAHQGMIFPMR
jgi:hypothetical protein